VLVGGILLPDFDRFIHLACYQPQLASIEFSR